MVSVFTEEELSSPMPRALELLGSWAKDKASLKKYANAFSTAIPYEHVIIDDFLDDAVAQQVEEDFPSQYRKDFWHCYNNPLEKKLACNRVHDLSELTQKVFRALNCPEVIDLMKTITGLKDLEADPYLHGGGIHCYPRGAKLDMHLDYSIHPKTGKERRINVILYLSRWNTSWNGATEFWDENMTECRAKSDVRFNRALVFRTGDISYHGVPDIISCPEDQPRKSIAVYYVSEPRPDAPHRMKAQYVPRPRDVASEMYDRFRALRPTKLLSVTDLEGWQDEERRIAVEELRRNIDAGKEIYPPYIPFMHKATH